jgi:hypothetical protein
VDACPHCKRPYRRSAEQNALLHATLGEIAKQKKWDGELMTIEEWKRLLVAAWMRATGRSVKLVRAIDGHGVEPLYQRTSVLNKEEASELCEYVIAWWAQQNG